MHALVGQIRHQGRKKGREEERGGGGACMHVCASRRLMQMYTHMRLGCGHMPANTQGRARRAAGEGGRQGAVHHGRTCRHMALMHQPICASTPGHGGTQTRQISGRMQTHMNRHVRAPAAQAARWAASNQCTHSGLASM